jgi:hypothetical protein
MTSEELEARSAQLTPDTFAGRRDLEVFLQSCDGLRELQRPGCTRGSTVSAACRRRTDS